MKKYLTLRTDVSDLKAVFRDVLKEQKVLTKDELANALKPYATKADLAILPTIKEIEKTLESYPTKEELKQELTNAIMPILTEIKKLRKDIAGTITSPSSTLQG